MSDSDEENPDRQLKIVIMGDGASGKVSHSLTQSQVSTLELAHCHWAWPWRGVWGAIDFGPR